MGDSALKWIAGSLVTAVGAGYVALEFIPSIEPPANMRYAWWLIDLFVRMPSLTLDCCRDADATWGAEQI